MDCKIAQSMLGPYLDNELERADARALEQHVDGCAECRLALAALDDLRSSLRDDALRQDAPIALRERIAAGAVDIPVRGIGSLPVRRRPESAWLRTAAAMVLAFGAGGISVHWWNAQRAPTGRQEQVTRDLFASHWRALAATSPVDVISTDRHTVKPWFAGKLAEAPLVQDFADQGFALVGGRLDYVGNERVAVLVYRHGQHIIDVFLLAESARAAARESAQGYSLNVTALGGQTAAVVSDMDDQETSHFLTLLASAR